MNSWNFISLHLAYFEFTTFWRLRDKCYCVLIIQGYNELLAIFKVKPTKLKLEIENGIK